MLLTIETANKIISDALSKRWSSGASEHCDIKAGDFDGSSYKIFASPEAKSKLTISVGVECFDELKKHGAEEIIKEKYGDLVVAPLEGFSTTLEVDEETLDAEKKAALLESIPLLKRYVMMAPLTRSFDAFLAKQDFAPIRVPYRSNENMYIVKEKDSIIITFSLKFTDPDDIVLSKMFLQEFKDARKNDRTVNFAPAVSYFHGEKPLEIRNIAGGESDDPKMLADFAFVSFALFDRHMDARLRDKTVDLLLNFRNYFHYHLKCAKAYMHFRMRDRVTKLLQNLEAAKDTTGIVKAKKTITGRTFSMS